MSEIRGRLLIGGMVLRNLEVSLDDSSLDSESGWAGTLLIDPSQQEFLQTGRLYRLELDDERASQIEFSHLERVPGELRLRAQIRGCSPLKWSPYAHEFHHEAAITLMPLVPVDA